MESLIFYLLIILGICCVGKGMLSTDYGILKFPTLFSVVILSWIVPQIYLIRAETHGLDDSLVAMCIMTIFTILSVEFGWYLAVSKKVSRQFKLNAFNIIKHTAIIFTSISVLTALYIVGDGGGVGGTQSGIITILLFFNSLKLVSLFLSLFLFLRYKSKVGLYLSLINIAVYFPFVFLYFRRQAIAEVAVCLVLAFWFARGYRVSRALFLGSVLIGFMLVAATEALRSLASFGGTWQYLDLFEVVAVLIEGWTAYSGSSNYNEVLNAVQLFSLLDQTGEFSFGAGTWNRLVMQWIPAQLVGVETKMAFMLEDKINESLYGIMRYEIPTGSTITGIADAYIQFWYLGSLAFFATSYWMGRWWRLAHLNDPWAMALYLAGLVPALMTITHSLIHFINGIALSLIFLYLSRASFNVLARR